MPRRKKRKTKKNLWKSVKNFTSDLFRLSLKVIPLVIILVMGSALVMGVRNALYADSNLLVQAITVEPSHALSQDVKHGLETKLIGQNILKVDLNKIATDLEKDPHIKIAAINREFPTNLKIEITERIPIGLIQFKPKQRYGLIADDGMILDVIKSQKDSLLVFEVYGLGLSRPEIGVQVKSPGFEQAVQFIRKYWVHSMAEQEPISRIALDSVGNVTITLGNGPKARLGRKPLERFEALERVIPLIQGKKRSDIAYIDLQYDDVIIKRK